MSEQPGRVRQRWMARMPMAGLNGQWDTWGSVMVWQIFMMIPLYGEIYCLVYSMYMVRQIVRLRLLADNPMMIAQNTTGRRIFMHVATSKPSITPKLFEESHQSASRQKC